MLNNSDAVALFSIDFQNSSSLVDNISMNTSPHQAELRKFFDVVLIKHLFDEHYRLRYGHQLFAKLTSFQLRLLE